MTAKDRPTIGYADHPPTRRSTNVVELLAVVFLIVALYSGFSAYITVKRGEWTPAYEKYQVAWHQQRQIRPSYVPPPFTGRKHVYESVWELGGTYIALAASAAAVLTFVVSTRRGGKGVGNH